MNSQTLRDGILLASLLLAGGAAVYSAIEMVTAAPGSAHVVEAVGVVVALTLVAGGLLKQRDDARQLPVALIRWLLIFCRQNWLRTGIFVALCIIVSLLAVRLGVGSVVSARIACGDAEQIACDPRLSASSQFKCLKGDSPLVTVWLPWGNIDERCRCLLKNNVDVNPARPTASAQYTCPEIAKDPHVSADEIEVLNEWVAVIDTGSSYQEAKDSRDRFNQIYPELEHINAQREPIWKNDIRLVRSLEEDGKWMVVIDMYPGSSSKQCIDFGIKEMQDTLYAQRDSNNYRDLSNRIESFLKLAKPLCYDLSKFEKTYGPINDRSTIAHQEKLGSCETKVKQKHPDRYCSRDDDP